MWPCLTTHSHQTLHASDLRPLLTCPCSHAPAHKPLVTGPFSHAHAPLTSPCSQVPPTQTRAHVATVTEPIHASALRPLLACPRSQAPAHQPLLTLTLLPCQSPAHKPLLTGFPPQKPLLMCPCLTTRSHHTLHASALKPLLTCPCSQAPARKPLQSLSPMLKPRSQALRHKPLCTWDRAKTMIRKYLGKCCECGIVAKQQYAAIHDP